MFTQKRIAFGLLTNLKGVGNIAALYTSSPNAAVTIHFLNAEQTFGISAQNYTALDTWLHMKEMNAGARIVNAQKFGQPKKAN